MTGKVNQPCPTHVSHIKDEDIIALGLLQLRSLLLCTDEESFFVP